MRISWESMSPGTRKFLRTLYQAAGMAGLTFFLLLAFDSVSDREAWSLIGLQFFSALGFRASESVVFDRPKSNVP